MTEQKKNSGEGARRIKRELLKIDGKSVEIILRTNPRARRFIVKVDPSTGQVSVVAPSTRSLDRALDFARKEKNWIAGRLATIPDPVHLEIGSTLMFRGIEYAIRPGYGHRTPVWIDRDAVRPTLRVEGNPAHSSRRLLDWLKREARRRIDERVFWYAAQLGVRPRRITIRASSVQSVGFRLSVADDGRGVSRERSTSPSLSTASRRRTTRQKVINSVGAAVLRRRQRFATSAKTGSEGVSQWKR